jgi:hypothetical protein
MQGQKNDDILDSILFKNLNTINVTNGMWSCVTKKLRGTFYAIGGLDWNCD